MCIILFSPDGHLPKKHMANCLDNNPDGWGIMWPENGNIQIVQGMTQDEFWKDYKWLRDIKAPKVFHARIRTHGKVSLENCHPFMVPGHGALAVAHNGIIAAHSPDKDSDSSDTVNFVNEVLAGLPEGFIYNRAMHLLLSDYVGYSKLVFMDGDGKVYIINEKEGTWEGKRWYSNNSFRWKRTTYVRPATSAFCGCDSTKTCDYHKKADEYYGEKAAVLGFQPKQITKVSQGYLVDDATVQQGAVVLKSESIEQIEGAILDKIHMLSDSEQEVIYAVLEQDYIDSAIDWDQLNEDQWLNERYKKLSEINDQIQKELLFRRFAESDAKRAETEKKCAELRSCDESYWKSRVPERIYGSAAAEEVRETILGIQRRHHLY